MATGSYLQGNFDVSMDMHRSQCRDLHQGLVFNRAIAPRPTQTTANTIVSRVVYGLLILVSWLSLPSTFLAESFLAVSAVAQQSTVQQSTVQPTQTGPKPGEANLEYSRVFIFVDRTTSLGHTHGVEGKLKSGRLAISAKEPGSLVFDMKSFVADTETARKVLNVESTIDEATRRKVNENMLGPEILNVNRYPEAKFENIRVTATGKTSNRKLPEYILEGDFTLHKTTRHLQIRCDLEEKDGWHHLRGSFKILQTDYGIKPYTKMLGAVGIKDELMILGDIWLVPAP